MAVLIDVTDEAAALMLEQPASKRDAVVVALVQLSPIRFTKGNALVVTAQTEEDLIVARGKRTKMVDPAFTQIDRITNCKGSRVIKQDPANVAGNRQAVVAVAIVSALRSRHLLRPASAAANLQLRGTRGVLTVAPRMELQRSMQSLDNVNT